MKQDNPAAGTAPSQDPALPEPVLESLHQLSVGPIGDLAEIHCEALPRNPERRDFRSRRVFRVFTRTRTLCHLTVDSDLRDLWNRTQALAKACPGIVCRPLFFHSAGGRDYLAIEYFQGETLETLVSEGRLSVQAALQHASSIVSAFESTSEVSTPEAAREELQAFFQRVLASPIFSDFDQAFLKDLVFPFISQGLLSQHPLTRWSNGDLVPRNVLVDSQGAVRLVDYEHAARSHFFREDWWRWNTFSSLPAEARDLPALNQGRASAPSLEAYFILRQLVLSFEICIVQVSSTDAEYWVGKLLQLLSAAHAEFRGSRFLQPLAKTLRAGGAPIAAPDTRVWAQLFWSGDGNFSEGNSHLLDYLPDRDVVLRFVIRSPGERLCLRFDPCNLVGLVRIEGILVGLPHHPEPLLHFSCSVGWEGLTPGAGVLRLVDSPAMNLLALNRDPCLLLPALPLGESFENLLCEVSLHFRPDISSLPDYLSGRVARSFQEELSQIRQARTALTLLLNEQASCVENLRHRAQLSAVKLKSEHQAELARQEELARAKLTELETTLARSLEKHKRLQGRLLNRIDSLLRKTED